MRTTSKVLAATALLAAIPLIGAGSASAHVAKDPHNGVACTPVPAPGTTPPPNIKMGPNFWWCLPTPSGPPAPPSGH